MLSTGVIRCGHVGSFTYAERASPVKGLFFTQIQLSVLISNLRLFLGYLVPFSSYTSLKFVLSSDFARKEFSETYSVKSK